MLEKLDLDTLQQRRKNARLVFLFKIVRGMVPAIDSANYLTPITNRRKIIPKSRPNSESSNIVEKFCINHSNCFTTKNPKTQQYKNYFFVKTIHDWNALDNIAVCANTVESFKSALTGRDWPDSTPPTHYASSGFSVVQIQIQIT